MTEAEMKTLREMFVDVAGEMGKSIQDQIGAQIGALEKSVNGRFDELSGRVDGIAVDVAVLKTDMAEVKADVKTIVARLDVNDADVRDARVKLALLTRAKG